MGNCHNGPAPRAHSAPGPLSDMPMPACQPRLNAAYIASTARVDQMIANGFIDEVRRLDEQGHAAHVMRLRSLGYREFLAYLHGEQTREEATARMKQLTRNFAKRQLTWFRADRRIRWIVAGSDDNAGEWASEILNRFQLR